MAKIILIVAGVLIALFVVIVVFNALRLNSKCRFHEDGEGVQKTTP